MKNSLENPNWGKKRNIQISSSIFGFLFGVRDGDKNRLIAHGCFIFMYTFFCKYIYCITRTLSMTNLLTL